MEELQQLKEHEQEGRHCICSNICMIVKSEKQNFSMENASPVSYLRIVGEN